VTRRSRFVVTAVALLGLLAPLAACGSDNSDKPSGGSSSTVGVAPSNQVTSTSFVGGQAPPADATNGGGNPGTASAGG
jgi:hypothetical protein